MIQLSDKPNHVYLEPKLNPDVSMNEQLLSSVFSV